MIETAVMFGPQSLLMGMLAQPQPGAPAPVAFLMFNAGVLPRIGPHRLNVKLARALAQAGQTSLRFDLSGQGDSGRAVDASDSWTHATHDVRCAMDHLEQNFGIRRFALIGICSGAVTALTVAQLDPRVAGVLMFDGHWYPTRWSRPVRHWKRLCKLSLRRAAAAVWRRLPGVTRTATGPVAIDGQDDGSVSGNPPRAQFVGTLQALADRRVATFFVFSGSVIEYYSYANQFRDAFSHEAFFDKVRCDFRPEIDHTFISLEAQRQMIELVTGWVPEVHAACTSIP